MDVSEMRRLRDEAVFEMRSQIDQMTPIDLPKWVLMTLMLPLFMWAAMQMSARMVWALVLGWVKSPFIFLAILVDLLGIMWWFLKSSMERISRK